MRQKNLKPAHRHKVLREEIKYIAIHSDAAQA
jgi:hypothetical protein